MTRGETTVLTRRVFSLQDYIRKEITVTSEMIQSMKNENLLNSGVFLHIL